MNLNNNNPSTLAGKAGFIILQGDNRLTVEEMIAGLTGGSGEDPFFAMNTTRVDGSLLGFDEISTQVNMLPLGGSRRILIVDNAADMIGKKGAEEWLVSVIQGLPETTQLVLVLHDQKKFKQGSMVWNTYGGKHWFRKIAEDNKDKFEWIELPLPSDREMPDWIRKEAQRQGGSFHPRAAVELGRMIGNDLFYARQEVTKAIAYMGDGRQVSAEVIRLLCAASKEESIFSLVDAVGQRKGKLAFKLLNNLSESMPIQYIFSMLVRQVRLLILTKEALAAGGHEREVMAACKISHTFLAKKLINQSHQFNLEILEQIYRELDRMDEDSKVGRVNLEAAIDGLIAQISH